MVQQHWLKVIEQQIAKWLEPQVGSQVTVLEMFLNGFSIIGVAASTHHHCVQHNVHRDGTQELPVGQLDTHQMLPGVGTELRILGGKWRGANMVHEGSLIWIIQLLSNSLSRLRQVWVETSPGGVHIFVLLLSQLHGRLSHPLVTVLRFGMLRQQVTQEHSIVQILNLGSCIVKYDTCSNVLRTLLI